MTAWTLHPNSLQNPRDALAAARVNGAVFVSGGLSVTPTNHQWHTDILTWDPEHNSWSKVGDMATSRFGHAVTAVNYNVISQYCI